MTFVFVQSYFSNKSPTFTYLTFEDEQTAKTHVAKLLDASVDVESVQVFEHLATAKKVTETVWS